MGNAATSKKGDSAENGKKYYLTDALNDGTFDMIFSAPFYDKFTLLVQNNALKLQFYFAKLQWR